jgi:hypothetical protein
MWIVVYITIYILILLRWRDKVSWAFQSSALPTELPRHLGFEPFLKSLTRHFGHFRTLKDTS